MEGVIGAPQFGGRGGKIQLSFMSSLKAVVTRLLLSRLEEGNSAIIGKLDVLGKLSEAVVEAYTTNGKLSETVVEARTTNRKLSEVVVEACTTNGKLSEALVEAHTTNVELCTTNLELQSIAAEIKTSRAETLEPLHKYITNEARCVEDEVINRVALVTRGTIVVSGYTLKDEWNQPIGEIDGMVVGRWNNEDVVIFVEVKAHLEVSSATTRRSRKWSLSLPIGMILLELIKRGLEMGILISCGLMPTCKSQNIAIVVSFLSSGLEATLLR